MRNKILLFLLTFIGISQIAAASSVRDKYNFNSEWLLYVGDTPEAKEVRFQDTDWKKVTLPRPFNEDEAFRLSIEQLTDTVMWYRKHFRLPADSKNKKVFVEFEGVRQGADFYINGEYIGRQTEMFTIPHHSICQLLYTQTKSFIFIKRTG
jgi:beta-galactosidase/beta-glucuronidase